jgi:aspartate ammonia-lyase
MPRSRDKMCGRHYRQQRTLPRTGREEYRIVTALNPVIGYENSTAIAKEALQTNRSVYDIVLEKGLLTKEKLDELLSPENMMHPRYIKG